MIYLLLFILIVQAGTLIFLGNYIHEIHQRMLLEIARINDELAALAKEINKLKL